MLCDVYHFGIQIRDAAEPICSVWFKFYDELHMTSSVSEIASQYLVMVLSTFQTDKLFIIQPQLRNENQNSRAFVKPHFMFGTVRCVTWIDYVTSTAGRNTRFWGWVVDCCSVYGMRVVIIKPF